MTAPPADAPAPATDTGFTRAVFPDVDPTAQGDSVLSPPAPDTPDAALPAADAPPADSATQGTSADRPRDAQGRFITADAPAEAETPAAVAPADASSAPAEIPPNVPVLPDGTPWAVKVDGQDYTFEGARTVPGVGLIIPEGQLDDLHRMLGRGIKFDVLRARDVAALETERTADAVDKEAVRLQSEFFAKLAQLSPEEILREAMQFRSEMPRLRTEARAEHLQRQLDARERASQPAPQELYAYAVSQAEEAIRDTVADLKKGPHAPWAQRLTDQDWKDIAEDAIDQRQSFVQQAPHADESLGIAQGDWVLAEAKVRERAAWLGQRYQSRRDEITAANTRATQATANAARMQPTVNAPPTVAGTPDAAPRTSRDAPPIPQTREEWLKFVSPNLA